MGWEDRDYYRNQPQSPISGPLGWILYGSVPLFTVFNIRVRAHASLIILCGLILVFGLGFGPTASSRIYSVTSLFAIILLHEFGHCFAARWTGGSANDILMTPLGGLAMAAARPKPWPTFVTVAGGPLVNVVLCLLCGGVLFAIGGGWPLLPSQFYESLVAVSNARGPLDIAIFVFFLYGVSYGLLLFNLLPVFPMDGGQLLQSILWKPLGYYRAMMITLNVGIAGAVLMMMAGLAGVAGYGLLVTIIGLNCLMNCIQTRQVMKSHGPWAFSEQDGPDHGPWFGGNTFELGYVGGGINDRRPKKSGPGWIARKRAEREKQAEVDEQGQIDAILAKVSAHGMQSLSRSEKKALQRATENQRKRDEMRSRAAR